MLTRLVDIYTGSSIVLLAASQMLSNPVPLHDDRCLRGGPARGLETEDLVLELADGPGLGETKTLGRLLHGGNHRRGAADEDLHVAGRRRKLLLDHIGRDEANTPSPTLRGIVEDVMYTELGVTGGKRVEIGLEQDVVGVYVGEDEVDLGLVASGAAAVDGLDDLQHGSDTSSACNHAEVPDHVGCVDHGALGTLDLHLVADVEVCNMLGDVAGGVRLDQEIEETLVVVGGGGGVGAHNFLGLAFDIGGEGDVLADGKTENVALLGEFEAVAIADTLAAARGERMTDVHCRVVGEDRLLAQLELLESIRLEYLASTACGRQRLLG